MKRSKRNIFTRILIALLSIIGYLMAVLLVTLSLLYVLIILSSHCKAQTVFRMPMNIQEVRVGGVRECHNDTTVIWGFHRDTIFFVFKQKAKLYYPVTNRTRERRFTDKHKRIEKSIARHSRPSDKYYLVQDHFNETYFIRIMEIQGKFVIFVTNIDYGVPNYVFGFNCSECK